MSGALQEALAICVDYDFFDTLGVGIWVMDYDVDVMRGRSKVLMCGLEGGHAHGEHRRCRPRDRQLRCQIRGGSK